MGRLHWSLYDSFLLFSDGQLNASCLLAIYAKVWSAGLMGKIFALRRQDRSS